MTDIADLTLVLGGARSGKTARAVTLAEGVSVSRIYLATGQAFDAEMADRIARHQDERGPGWRTIESPLDIATSLSACPVSDVVLLDCLTLWLSNLMHADRDLAAETDALLQAIRTRAAPVIAVSNEVGMGIVPETPLGRAFRDEQGWLNQRVAAHAARVEFVAAGLPLRLK